MRRYQRLAPLRRCPACGERFRSWREDRYCTRRACRETRLGGSPETTESLRDYLRRTGRMGPTPPDEVA